MKVAAPMTDPTTYLDYHDCVALEKSALDLKERLVVSLMFRCGMRVSEVMRLQKKDIIIEKDPTHSVVIATGKREKKRRIPIFVGLQGALAAWVEPLKPEDWVFPSTYNTGRPLTVRWAQYMLDRVASKAEIGYDKGGKKLHPHTLRHSLAIFLINQGMKLPKIQSILGHSSLASTSYYLQFSHSEIAEDYHVAFGAIK